MSVQLEKLSIKEKDILVIKTDTMETETLHNFKQGLDKLMGFNVPVIVMPVDSNLSVSDVDTLIEQLKVIKEHK